MISFLLVTIVMALAQDDDIPSLNPTYKALIGSAVFPSRETASSEHNTSPSIQRS